MDIRYENASQPNTVLITVTVPMEEVYNYTTKSYEKNKGKFTVPSFPAGKAPRKIIESQYGSEIFLEDAVNMIVDDAMNIIISRKDPEFEAFGNINITKASSKSEVVFTVEAALKPAVILGTYKGLSFKKAVITVNDDEISKEIEKARQEKSIRIRVNRSVKNGDEITLDFKGYVDGVAFDGGEGYNYPLVIGSNTFIPGFEEALIGARINEKTTIKVTFPDNYNESLGGKDAEFVCTVKSVSEKTLPDDEELSKIYECNSLEEYRSLIRNYLMTLKEEKAQENKENTLLSKAVANAKIQIPDIIINNEVITRVNQMKESLEKQGASYEVYLKYTGNTDESIKEAMKQNVIYDYSASLVLDAIAVNEKLECSESETEAEFERLAEEYGMDVANIKQVLGEDGTKQVRDTILRQKAGQLIMDTCIEE